MTPLPIDHLVVPLDGSRLAEASLPAAAALAGRLAARVTLLHVLERNAPAAVHGEHHLRGAVEAEAYLAGVAGRLAGTGTAVDTHAHANPEGDVAASIAAHAAELGAGLVVLCAHGHGGVRGWLSGSIAQQVVRRVTPPVLLVRAGAGSADRPFAPGTVVAALDGTAEGEAALPAAAALAAALGAGLRLVVVVATLGTVGGDRAAVARIAPRATAAALDLEEEAATDYLARLGGALADAGVPVRSGIVRGDVAGALARAVGQGEHAVLALATHGGAGFDALWSGSVGPRVVDRAGGPLLLVHPGWRGPRGGSARMDRRGR